MPTQYDVVIIGAGPSGEGCAMRASKQGLRVAVVDDQGSVGGNCTHWGTIPSKALRHAVQQIIRFNTDNMFRDIGEPRNFSFARVLKRAEAVIQKQVDLRTSFYAKNRVKLYFGQARFVDPHTLEVCQGEGVTETLKANNIVICTGSRPYHPPNVDFNLPRLFDSDSILSLDFDPKKIIIYGAGVIGCEYACIFCGLGMRVELIDTRAHLMDFLDQEISEALSYHLREVGVVIRHGEVYEQVEGDDNKITLYLKSGKRIKADAMLWCNGRVGNTDTLSLELAGLEANNRGQLQVNQDYQTNVPHIYAAGDVVGWPALASAAYDQGRSVGAAIAHPEDKFYVSNVPVGIYTLPEISSLGRTEEELTREKIPYEIGKAHFKTLARAQLSNETVGMLKILFHRETYEILGIHCFGYQAAEIVHIGQAIMSQKGEANSLRYFTHTTFNYPTMAEAYRVAALNGYYRTL
ncbi:MAG: Si-specific NAD(P)(+) transhydrogenase [Gammaproteobacteria bacterium]